MARFFGKPSRGRAKKNLAVLGRHYRRVLKEFREKPVKTLLSGSSRVYAVDVRRGLKLVELRRRRKGVGFEVVDVEKD